MRIMLLVAVSLGLTGCWKTIHEPGEPPVQDASAVERPGTAVPGHADQGC